MNRQKSIFSCGFFEMKFTKKPLIIGFFLNKKGKKEKAINHATLFTT